MQSKSSDLVCLRKLSGLLCFVFCAFVFSTVHAAEPTATLLWAAQPDEDADTALFIAGAVGADATAVNEDKISSFILKTNDQFTSDKANSQPLNSAEGVKTSEKEISATNFDTQSQLGGEDIISLGHVIPSSSSTFAEVQIFLETNVLPPRYVPGLGSGAIKPFLLAAVDGCDFIGADGKCDLAELSELTTRLSAGAPVNASHDLNGDGAVDLQDLHVFRAQAGLIQDLRDSVDNSWSRILIGDVNLDHEVSFSDFLVLAENFGGPGPWETGNFDADSSVDFGDFLALADNFGRKLNIGSTQGMIAAIPEPTSQTAVFVSLAFVIRSARRRRR